MERPDQRNKTRIHFETSISLRVQDRNILTEASSRDISLDGVFIRTTETVPLNSLCEVGITLTGASSSLVLRIKGRIVRQDSAGIAVHFTEFELDSYMHLKNIVLYNQIPDQKG